MSTVNRKKTAKMESRNHTRTLVSFVRALHAVILLVGLPLSASAQFAVDHWTTENGLPFNTVRSGCQTPDGYLWLTTLDGLVRFDGVHFTTFDKGNTPGIQGNRFGQMVCTADGDYWVGAEGSGITRYHQGHFTTYTVRDGLQSDIINGISGDAAGNLWALTVSGGVSRWDPATQRFLPLDRDAYRYALPLGGNGQGIFYGTSATSLHVFDRGVQREYPLPTGWPRDGRILVARDLAGEIWLSHGDSSLAHLVNGSWQIPPATPARLASSGAGGFTTDYRTSTGQTLHIDNRWDTGGALYYYLSLPGIEPGKIAFTALFADREGNLWLCTDGQGLYRLRSRTILVRSVEEGLPDRNIYPIYQSTTGDIWVGTWNGGVSRYRDGKVTTFTTANGLASNRVMSIGEGPGGEVWVSVEGGLHRMHNGRFEFVHIADSNLNQTVRAIHMDPGGVMWFGTDSGLFRMDHGQWTVLTKKDGLPTDDIRVILDARDGGLWVGGYGGIARLQNGRLKSWAEQDGLPGNTVRALYEDAAGVLWIGTYDSGLARLAQGRVTRYSNRDGLFDNGVFQMLEDSRGNLWMSSNRGIYRVAKRQLEEFAAGKTDTISSISYGRQDGLRNPECNGGLWPAGIRSHDGRLWFPTQDGVAIIDPARLPPAPPAPPVVVESCLIDHTPVPIDRPVRVLPGHDNLEIHYTALTFVNSQYIRFRYQLGHLDNDWVAAGTRRTAYYPHLPPGTYTFNVTAAPADGSWNNAPAHLTIVVLPRFYQTWWFAVLLALMAAMSIWLGWKRRIAQLKRDAAAQHAFSRQLIASQENERKRVAAELHDSIGQRLVVIKNRALLLLRPYEGVSLNPALREQVEEISSEVSEAVREVKEISYDLRPYRLDRLGLTTALQGMIETAADSSGIQFETDIDNIDAVLPGQTEINFYRIVQECVNNILRHSHATKASIRIKRSAERLELVVTDNGRGFTPDETHMGFGLAGIKQRAQLLAGELDLESIPGHGTTLIIVIDLLSI